MLIPPLKVILPASSADIYLAWRCPCWCMCSYLILVQTLLTSCSGANAVCHKSCHVIRDFNRHRFTRPRHLPSRNGRRARETPMGFEACHHRSRRRHILLAISCAVSHPPSCALSPCALPSHTVSCAPSLVLAFPISRPISHAPSLVVSLTRLLPCAHSGRLTQ